MAVHVHLDFETRSYVSVKDVGAFVYSRRPDTDILCTAYAVDDSDVQIIKCRPSLTAETQYIELANLASDPDTIFIAHNAFFEQCIWRNIMVPRYGFAPIPIERWRCTAAKAASFSLPRSLKGVAEALGLTERKDDAGNRIMMKLASPRRRKTAAAIEFWEYGDAPADFEALYAYCAQDVVVERAVDNALPNLNAREQKVWFLDQTINFRGIQLDVPAANQILKFIDTTVSQLKEEFVNLTDGEVTTPTQVMAFREWLDDNGVTLDNLQAPTVDKVLAQGKENIDANAYRALEIRRALSKISTSKYTAMLNRVDPSDGRLRDILLYCAALTKRWGGRGVQPQNLPRGSVKSDIAIEHILLGDYDWLAGLYPDLMAVYSSCIRGMFTASRGCELFVSDFSSIEAVTLPWLAGQQDTLTTFAEGKDLYCAEAAGVFGRVINKKSDPYERQVGKVSVLALGFGGGIGAFGTMARGYGVSLDPAYAILWDAASEDEKERARSAYSRYIGRAESDGNPDPLPRSEGYAADIIKQRWRRKNERIVAWWYELENAAIQAVLTGQKQIVGGHDAPEIIYGMYGQHLLCKLPSGNCLVYPFAKIGETETDWGSKSMTLTYCTQGATYQYIRTHSYGGKLAENITQAVSRDILADAMLRVEAAGYPIVLHVHDEIVADVPVGRGSLEHFNATMAESPSWAAGLPIRTEAWKGYRYKK